MKTSQMLDHRARTVIATSGRINFADLTDELLLRWDEWFASVHEHDFLDPRKRSYFRVNFANLKAEIMWRKKEIPF